MRRNHTAIIHLRDPKMMPNARAIFEPMLRVVRGVHQVQFDPKDSLVKVHFNSEITSLAEIVRVIEDLGPQVESIAQRPSTWRMAG